MPRPPCFVTSSAVANTVPPNGLSPALPLRPVIYTVAPAAPSAIAIPLPTPRLAPVTRQTRPFSMLDPCQMMSRDKAEGHCRTERRARAGVARTHDGGGGVANRIETWDRLTVGAHHAREFVGQQAPLGSDIPRLDAQRIEGRFGNRPQARIRLDVDVAIVTIEGVGAFFELLVIAAGRVLIHPLRGVAKPGRIDLDLPCERLERIGFEIDLAQPVGWERFVGTHHAGQKRSARIFAPEVRIEDEPRRQIRGALLVVRVHRVDDIAIGRGFIDKAAAEAIHQHASGKGALDEYRAAFFAPGDE